MKDMIFRRLKCLEVAVIVEIFKNGEKRVFVRSIARISKLRLFWTKSYSIYFCRSKSML